MGGARGMRGIAEVWAQVCGAMARREQRRSPSTRATPPLCGGRSRTRDRPDVPSFHPGQVTARRVVSLLHYPAFEQEGG